jgi:subtilisin family serine protease
MGISRLLIALVATSAVMIACDGLPVESTGYDSSSQAAVESSDGSRRDNPWWKMSDAELIAATDSAHGRVFIGFKDTGTLDGVTRWGRVVASDEAVRNGKQLVIQLGGLIEREYTGFPVIVARIHSDLIPVLRRHDMIDYLEPIFPGVVSAQDTTWNVKRVNAPLSWPLANGSGVKVNIIDTGAGESHPDLFYQVHMNCYEQAPGVDTSGHGTAVAGIIAALNNFSYVIGASHGVDLWSTKVGIDGVDPAAVYCALLVARANNTFVINMSFRIDPYTAVTDQINAAYHQNGFILVAAAGNTSGGPVTYPANLPEVIAVTATDSVDARWPAAAQWAMKSNLLLPAST